MPMVLTMRHGLLDTGGGAIGVALVWLTHPRTGIIVIAWTVASGRITALVPANAKIGIVSL